VTNGDGRVSRADPPPELVVRVVNPVLKLLLRSPLHWLVSDSLLLLVVAGRTTGTEYTFPVGYEQDGRTVTVTSHGTNWWKNLRGGGQRVSMVLRGARRSGHAELVADDEAVAGYLHGYFERHGVGGARRFGLEIDGESVPDEETLRDAVGHVVLVRIDLGDAYR